MERGVKAATCAGCRIWLALPRQRVKPWVLLIVKTNNVKVPLLLKEADAATAESAGDGTVEDLMMIAA